MTANKSLHQFDNGFIPTADRACDNITVTRNSPLISGVRRKRPGEYLIHSGSFIVVEVAAVTLQLKKRPNLSQSPHWAQLMRLTKELGWDDVHRYLATK